MLTLRRGSCGDSSKAAGRGGGQRPAHTGLAQRPTCRLFRSSKPWARGGTRPERLRPADDDDRLQGPHAGPRHAVFWAFLSTHFWDVWARAKYRLGRKTHSGNTTERHRGRRIKNLKGQAPKLPNTNASVGHVPAGRRDSVLFPLKTDKYS